MRRSMNALELIAGLRIGEATDVKRMVGEVWSRVERLA